MVNKHLIRRTGEIYDQRGPMNGKNSEFFVQRTVNIYLFVCVGTCILGEG